VVLNELSILYKNKQKSCQLRQSLVPQSLDGFPAGLRIGQKGLDLRTKSIKPLIKSIKPLPTVPRSLDGVPAGPRPGQKALDIRQPTPSSA